MRPVKPAPIIITGYVIVLIKLKNAALLGTTFVNYTIENRQKHLKKQLFLALKFRINELVINLHMHAGHNIRYELEIIFSLRKLSENRLTAG